eukprot:6183242-Pleurochrysis_carterae.AAC.3
MGIGVPVVTVFNKVESHDDTSWPPLLISVSVTNGVAPGRRSGRRNWLLHGGTLRGTIEREFIKEVSDTLPGLNLFCFLRATAGGKRLQVIYRPPHSVIL